MLKPRRIFGYFLGKAKTLRVLWLKNKDFLSANLDKWLLGTVFSFLCIYLANLNTDLTLIKSHPR